MPESAEGDVVNRRVLERWGAAGERLGLGEGGVSAGAILLAAELGVAGTALPSVIRRMDILELMAARHGRETALQGLLALEARGAAQASRWESGAWLSQQIEVAPQVREFCAGAGGAPATASSDFHAPERVRAAIELCLAKVEASPQRYLVVLRGRSGSGRDEVLRYLLGRLGLSARERSVFELRAESDRLEPELSGSVPVWDARKADPGPDDYTIARRWLARSCTVAVALVDTQHDTPDVSSRIALRLDVDPQDQAERCSNWVHALRALPMLEARRRYLAEALARRSRAGVGLAMRAVAGLGEPAFEDAAGLLGQVEQALDEQVQPSATRGIVVEQPVVTLDDVVAGPATTQALERLRVLCESHAHIGGFKKGVAALLSGPSGTGKTMAARALASSLRRPLYRVDLASVVSKWVGETEKNLRDALVAAEASGAILLFDEGDALFGKRGEVAKGSDRYANLEVSYLLQALEAFEGIAVVTTNLRTNVDQAFARRFDAIIEFAAPNHEQRLRIWHQELGEACDSLLEIELRRLAKAAEMLGGNIASATRIALATAHSRGAERVEASDLHLAIESEFTKLGSAVQASNWRRSMGNGRA